MTGREWKSAAASIVLHGSLIAGALALSGFAHDADTAVVIDFSLLPTRTVPGENPAGAPVPSVEEEGPAADGLVAENPARAVAKPPLPAKKPVPPPVKPAPLLQEETETAAPAPMPVKPAEEIVEDLPEEQEVVAPAATTVASSHENLSDATPPSNREQSAGAAETPPNNHPMPPSRAASGEGLPSRADSGDRGDSLSAANPSGAAGTEGDLPGGGTPSSRRDFSFIREKVQRNTRYPRLARRMGLEGQVKVSFTVCHDGKVTDIRVMESSGASILDKCAIEAVKKTSPFPSQQLEAKVIIPIVYRLNGQKE